MPARILIIEDDPANRELAAYLLDAAGYSVATASDGGAGAQLAITGNSDLILCDLHMPVMDGYAVLATLRADMRWRPVPIVAFSASTLPGERERAQQAGFDDYLPKPFIPHTFVERVESYLPFALRINR